MQLEQRRWTEAKGWSLPSALGGAKLVLVFGSPGALCSSDLLGELRGSYPGATLFGCSTAGEICGVQVTDDTLVATALRFESTTFRTAFAGVASSSESFAAGAHLAKALGTAGLTHLFVLSDGLRINGTDLVRGLTEHLPGSVAISGGLAGDGARFKSTFVLADGEPASGVVAALGFYGDRLQVSCASLGGWDVFGPDRLITRSKGNVLYELDGKSALDLYKQYLGEHSRDLPASGLLFPLSLRTAGTNAELARAKDEAQSASRAKSEFLANMRHELRTPLNSILGFAEILAEATEGISPELREYAGHIVTSGRTLLALINDLLDLANLEAGRLEFKPVPINVALALDDARKQAHRIAAERGVSLAVETESPLPPLEADEVRLRQILQNLLSNAVKFTPSGGKIRLRARAAGGAHLEISVVDTGVGIAPGDQERIFGRFEQLDPSASRLYQGTGLGLSLTKKLVELHGGTLFVESEVGKGSTFTFSLPLRRRDAGAQAEGPQR